MRKKIISVLIANIIFVSNVAFAPFISDAVFVEDETNLTENTQTEEYEEDVESEVPDISDEQDYVKISKFEELPEEIAYQEVKAGTALEDIFFPDTLNIDVVADTDHDERIAKQLGSERASHKSEDVSETEGLENEEPEDEELEEDSSDDIMFFDSETGEVSSGVIDKSDSSENDNEINDVESSDSVEDVYDNSSNSSSDNIVPADSETNDEEVSEDGDSITFFEETEAPIEEEENENGEGLIGKIKDVLGMSRVHAIDSVNDDEISHEMVSGIKWILDPVLNGTDEYDPNMVGMEYVFTPILLIPDFYYVEAKLPTITVKIIEEYFEFDETVEVDGVKIRVRADKGVFPLGASVNASKLDGEQEERVNSVLSEQIETDCNVVKSYSFDIKILDENGKEIEPDTEKGRVIVSFESEEITNESLKADIYHILDEKKQEDSESAVLGATRSMSEDNSSSDDIVVEKLAAVVVDVEDAKAIEAVTYGFSTYVLRFSYEGELNYEIKQSVVSLDDVLKELQIAQDDDGKEINTISTDDSLVNYIYVDTLEYEIDSSGQTIPTIDDNGLFKPINSGKWFLVVQKPQKNIETTLDITYGGLTYALTLSIGDISAETVDFENGGYPSGIELGTNSFKLKMPIRINSNAQEKGAVSYQWESSDTNVDSSFTPIMYANTQEYGVSSSSAVGKWYRCRINGQASNAVQVITKNSDMLRDWVGVNTDSDQCYITNGTMAYTLNSITTSAGRVVQTFDVIGDFEDDMLTTTASGEGWKVLSSEQANPISSGFGAGAALKELYFRFNENDPSILYGSANLPDGYRSFAFGEDTAIGNNSIATYATNGTIYANKNSGAIDCVTYMAVDSIQTASTKMKSKAEAIQLPAYAVLPITTTGLKVWMGIQNPSHPLAYTSSELNLLENKQGSLGMSWVNVPSGSNVEFAFSLDSLWDVYSLEKHKRVSNSSYYKPSELKTNVKGVSLNNEGKAKLQTYAETVGTPYDDVVVNMNFASAELSDSIIDEFKGKKNLTRDSQDSSDVGSTTAYFADIIEIDVNQTVTTNGSSSKSNVSEVVDNNKKAVLLPFEISYDFSDKKNITLLREHDGTVSSMSTSGSGERYKLDKSNGKIIVYAYKFSTYAVAYQSSIQYYTVTFDNGTEKTTVKVKSGDKVSQPSDPAKDGYTFKGWYLKGAATTGTSSSKNTTTASAYNFDTPITKNITLIAGWSAIKEAKGDTKGDTKDVNGDSRAPKTGDTLPIVWLWVIILVVGLITFAFSAHELYTGDKISTTIKFLVTKIRENSAKILCIISAIAIVGSTIALFTTRNQYEEAEHIYSEAEETYIEETPDQPEERPEVAGVKKEREEWKHVNVNMTELQKKYPEAVGWIYFENEDISYPIMFSGDNSKYVTTAYTGKKAKAGAIFVDCESSPDFSDPHSLVYGHNMKDMSMFGKLRYYETDPEYYHEHQYFQIFTNDSVYRYQIFACEEVADSHDVFWTFGKEPSNYWKTLKKLERDSLIDTGIQTNESDHVITLSTCTDDENTRLIVCGVRTDSYTY